MGEREIKYFKILELDLNASDDDIRKAYKRLALKYHPDKNNNLSIDEKKLMEDKFKEISTAYSVLITSNSRSKTNKSFTFNEDEMSHMTNLFMNNLYDQFDNFINLNKNKKKKVSDLVLTINISLEEIYKNKLKKINVKRIRKCHKCNANGYFTSNLVDCIICEGTGTCYTTTSNITCPNCYGSGVIEGNPYKKKCDNCNGKLYMKDYKIFQFRCGLDYGNNNKIKFVDEGDEKLEYEFPGDLIIYLNELPNDIFKRGSLYYDLVVTKKISVYELYYGTIFKLRHLDGREIIIQSNEIKNELIHVLEGEGMPINSSNIKLDINMDVKKCGNLYIKFEVEFPKLDNKKRELLKRIFKPLNSNSNNNVMVSNKDDVIKISHASKYLEY
jgi:DnaJ-class molecular chaperone